MKQQTCIFKKSVVVVAFDEGLEVLAKGKEVARISALIRMVELCECVEFLFNDGGCYGGGGGGGGGNVEVSEGIRDLGI